MFPESVVHIILGFVSDLYLIDHRKLLGVVHDQLLSSAKFNWRSLYRRVVKGAYIYRRPRKQIYYYAFGVPMDT